MHGQESPGNVVNDEDDLASPRDPSLGHKGRGLRMCILNKHLRYSGSVSPWVTSRETFILITCSNS